MPWDTKCNVVGCRETEEVIFWDGYYWCQKHFNLMQQQKCIDKGCRHPIPGRSEEEHHFGPRG